MDEFNLSGNTRDCLARFAGSMGLRILCYFCLIDFQPGSRKHEHRFNSLEEGRYLDNFQPLNFGWHEVFQRVMARFDGRTLAKPISSESRCAKPNFHNKVIMVGEQVIRDGSIPRYARNHNRDIYAVDMEGSGFAAACEHCKTPWLDIRGITDFGDPKKRDGWHVAASVAAATATRLFIEQEYRKEIAF